MKPIRELEPGLLPTFRLFIGIELAITALAVTHWFVAPFPPRAAIVTSAVITILAPGLLFLYLSLPALQRTFKSFYLPLGIVWASVGPILAPYISLYATGNNAPEISAQVMLWRNIHAISNSTPEIVAQVVLWQQFILLLIPLVVVSWQYGMREVILFCLLTTVLNITLLSRTMVFQEMVSSALLGVIFVQTIVFFLVGQMIVKLMKDQREQRHRLAEANERLAQYTLALEQLTISRERNRMARELHDVLAHTLSGVAVELEGMRSMLHFDLERANAMLNHSLQAIREGLTETRRALKEMRAKPLEDLGLALAVEALANSYANRFDLRIVRDIDHDLDDYPAEVQQCVYRITQEGLANIADHAQAHNAQVVLKRDGGQLHLMISDDGRGFDLRLPEEETHYGLLGMRERAEMIGGCLAVESQVGQGTKICFSYGAAND